MEQWIVTRHLKFRSELLFHWALLLEAEGKLKIDRIGQNPSQFPLRLLATNVPLLEGMEGISNLPMPNVHPMPHAAPPDFDKEEDLHLTSYETKDDDEDYQPPPESSRSEEAKSMDIVPEKRNSRKISRASQDKKRKREIEPEPVVQKRPNLLGLSAVLREELSNLRKEHVGLNHVERFSQVSTEIIAGVHMCGLVLKEVCKRNEEDTILVQDITCQIKEMNETRKRDQLVIVKLREEVVKLHAELYQSREREM